MFVRVMYQLLSSALAFHLYRCFEITMPLSAPFPTVICKLVVGQAHWISGLVLFIMRRLWITMGLSGVMISFVRLELLNHLHQQYKCRWVSEKKAQHQEMKQCQHLFAKNHLQILKRKHSPKPAGRQSMTRPLQQVS